ncbi:DUF448 domain-containing protein [Erythrobacter sp. F6033]|uniref:DUF448 domain-containing protein n=1 Tax=Erythrobacter sp. F6033 TaxID=2926401 RepID=UPI001FF0EAA7|nr:DUF448 domain-containing protein [Erythrobacter sp. F6033]MCK0127740.1 DUF448 domain-containing protein [Erythrobacter sp. F6033]
MRTPHNERVSSDIAETPRSRQADKASGSERRCILSGETHPRESLVRLAISPDGLVLPDPGAKAPGRGAWIAPDRAALEAAIADGHFKRALMRAFKGGPANTDGERVTLSYSDDLPQQIEMALTRHLTDRLGLEMRAGNVVAGSSRIEEQARQARLGLLLHTSDSSEAGRKKLDQAWRVGAEIEGSGARGQVLPLDRDALSVALGRENVVHLGVSGRPEDLEGSKKARAANRVAQAVNRLVGFAGGADAVCDRPVSDEALAAPSGAGGDDRIDT